VPVFTLPKSSHPDFALPNVKPKGPVEIDWSNSLSRGLVSYALFGRNGSNATEILYDVFGIGVDSGLTFTTVGSDGGLLLSQPGDTGWLVVAETGFDADVFSDHEATYAVRLRRNSADNNTFSAFTSSTLSHYPFSGVMYMSIFRDNRLTLTGVYDSALDDTLHNVVVTSSDSANEYKTYTGGIVRDTTTASWGLPNNTIDRALLDGNYKDAGFFGLWNRALTPEEVALIESDPYQILKPSLPLTYFVPAAAPAGGNEPLFYHHQRMLSRCF